VIEDNLGFIIRSSLSRTYFGFIGNSRGYFQWESDATTRHPDVVRFESVGSLLFDLSHPAKLHKKSFEARTAILFVSPASLHVMLLTPPFFQLFQTVKTIRHCSKEAFNNHLFDIRLCPNAGSSIGCVTRAIERRSIEYS
jgi:hypothetical protein